MSAKRNAKLETRNAELTPWLRSPWVVLALLAVITFVAYWPALGGQILWDDDAHIPKPELRSLGGLGRIWFDIGATQQYYPLLFSWFWVQHRLWGDDMLGYHLVNVLLHIGAAFLVYLILRQLKIPGALLAAAIFAVHPVHAESVAWVTEQKNTLSGVFYLGAMLAYLKFDETRGRSPYVWALVLFVLSMLSKTVTVTLPPALLIIFWWQRGRISWKRDVVPLLPFFALALADGLFTVWFERTIIGASGREFEPTWAEKPLLAGRALWFYLWTLFWPVNLIFINPRWQLDPASVAQWLFPVAAVALVVACWAVRRWSRAPLAALLFFILALAPVLGFLNVFFFRFSFVADHFQYLASLGIIVLVSAGIVTLIERLAPTWRTMGIAACALLVGVLTALTWNQSHLYGNDVVHLYRTTMQFNPDCWMMYSNLGDVLIRRGESQEALPMLARALELKPDNDEAQINVGKALANVGRLDESLAHFEKCVEQWPNSARMRNNLGVALALKGRLNDGVQQFEQAMRVDPNSPGGFGNYGAAMITLGRPQEAIAPLEKALQLDPLYQNAHVNLGDALIKTGQASKAIPHLERAAELNPQHVEARAHLAVAYMQANRSAEAVSMARQALELARAQKRADWVRQLEAMLNSAPAGSTLPPVTP